MFFTFAQIIAWLTQYKYIVLLPVSIVEGPIVTILGGFLSSQGYLNIFAVYALVILGDLIGDSMYYAAGRFGGKPFINRWGRYIGIKPHNIEKLERHFEKHSGKTMIIGKLSHAIGSVFLAAAGLVKMPFGRFLWFNFIATVPKSLVWLLVGFYFGQAYAEFGQVLNYAAFGFAALSFFLIIAYWLMIKFIKKIL